jgi:cytoskeletal protein CcmA (bactofilin family)
MALNGRTLAIVGEVQATGDIVVEGRIDGQLLCEGGVVVIAPSGDVRGSVLARDITVYGRMAGQLIATEIVDIRPTAIVKGDVIARRLVLDDAATFVGRVEPQHLEAAISVARYRQKQRTPLPRGSADPRFGGASL